MKRLLYTACLIATTIAAVVVTNATTRGQTTRFFMAGTGDWNVDANWGGFVPDGSFDEYAELNNAASVAQVGGAVPSVAQLTVGPGVVEIASGGSLTVEPGATLGAGTANIDGDGRVALASGGTLTTRTLNLNGVLQVASGGMSTSTGLNLNGTLELTGPNATVNVGGGSLAVNGGSTLLAKINSTSFKPIAVDGLARIRGGNLNVEFSGFTPATTDTFDIIDADVVDGSFDAVQVTGGPALQPYQVYAVNTQSGGATLQVDNRLVLSIDRATGMGTVTNMAPGSIDLDGYSVGSSLGSIGPTNFNSFADQGLDGASWSEIGTQSATGIAELRETGTTSLASASSRNIGAVYVPNYTALGVDPEDLTFHYSNADGVSIQGPIVYEGDKAWNNLVVNVDPTTGAATLVNESPFTFSFDGYTVTSASGSLLSDDDWDSLEEQGAGGGDWFEIEAIDDTKIGELKRSGSTSLSQGTSFDLGNIFDTAGTQDLVLEFIVSSEDAARKGVVDYLTAVVGPLPGDYDASTAVGTGDLNLVLDNWAGPVPPFPAGWTGDQPNIASTIGTAYLNRVLDNWGNTAGAGAALGAAAAVPEPSAAVFVVVALVAPLAFRRRAAATALAP